MSKQWIAVKTVTDEIDANLLKGILESAGIICIIEGNVYRPRSVAPMYNQFKLNVPCDQIEKARETLKEIEENHE